MRLKKLDIAGFKSFPERTQVRLVEGVTAIIGPNGCGKTNILDALRWVMGEQRPTLLRGGKMEDVIFNGSQAMKAHGMAEVSLSIENTRGILPTEYDEVQLTRRLFRSGESEYYLNRTQCRLRDITDLFADTGMGANAYSVIQQHMIDALISDKAEERRILFEEAAGITKYKQRKRAALRKLEATEQDLQRLQDIVSEVKTQVNSLSRQMKKAERYQQTHTELKSLELAVAKVTLDALDSERREKNLLLTEQQDLIQGAETTLAAVGAELEQERTRQDEFDARLSDAARKVQAKTEEGHTLDKRISGARERIESLSAQRERNITEIQACDRRAESLLADESTLKSQLVAAEEKLQRALAEVAAAEQRSVTADAQALDAKGAAESHTEKLLALEGRISSGRSDTQNLSQQEEELNARVSELSAALEQLTTVSGADAAEREQLSATVGECDQRLADTTAEAAAVNEQIESLTAQLDDRTERITDLSAALEATQTRMRLLEETIAQHEGFGAGVSAALDNSGRWPALLGAVADLITPREGRTLAIEAALDDIAGYLVTRDRRTAREVISYLASERKGKAAIFALEGFVSGGAAEPRRPVSESGFVGWADTLVTPHAEVAGLAQALLRNTAVFDESLDALSDAELTALLSRLPAETQVVSTAGTLYRGAGALAGGSEEGLPRFGRQERVRELKEKITALQSDLESARRAKNDDVAQIARLRARLSEVDERISGAREDKSDAEKRLTEVEAALRGHANERARLDKEKSAATGKLDLLKHRQYTLSLDVDQLATEKERLMSIVSERASALSELEAEAQRA
ncbi:MAG TPA: chromosome segregation protein SMC, partial [candidate division Zixibacteria bacterium]|nr:chromosome segregation protein SMC [candidate division Zixibacteria bacterium]